MLFEQSTIVIRPGECLWRCWHWLTVWFPRTRRSNRDLPFWIPDPPRKRSTKCQQNKTPTPCGCCCTRLKDFASEPGPTVWQNVSVALCSFQENSRMAQWLKTISVYRAFVHAGCKILSYAVHIFLSCLSMFPISWRVLCVDVLRARASLMFAWVSL